MCLLSTASVLVVAGCTHRNAGDAASGCVEALDVEAQIEIGAHGVAVAIAARDDRFDPGCIVVEEPGPVTLVVRNEGRHPHNIAVGPDLVSFDSAQVGILEIMVGAEGTSFVCTIHSAMAGEIRVRR